MKQGRASSNNMDGRKVEPSARAVSPSAVSQMGSAMGNMIGGKRVTSSMLYAGKGYEAPKGGREVFKCGSQGKR
jgi:hypothetical protein